MARDIGFSSQYDNKYMIPIEICSKRDYDRKYLIIGGENEEGKWRKVEFVYDIFNKSFDGRRTMWGY